MTSLPLIVRRTIIDQWAEELVRFPESRRTVSALHVNDRFCAVGVFADLSTRYLSRFHWMEQEVAIFDTVEAGGVYTTYAVRRRGYPGADIAGLPQEFRWILGFSVDEEYRISTWSDCGLPFADIASHLRTLYVGDDPVFENLGRAWQLVQAALPDRNRDPEYLDQIAPISAWPTPLLSLVT